jgi:hypothetical protein
MSSAHNHFHFENIFVNPQLACTPEGLFFVLMNETAHKYMDPSDITVSKIKLFVKLFTDLHDHFEESKMLGSEYIEIMYLPKDSGIILHHVAGNSLLSITTMILHEDDLPDIPKAFLIFQELFAKTVSKTITLPNFAPFQNLNNMKFDMRHDRTVERLEIHFTH